MYNFNFNYVLTILHAKYKLSQILEILLVSCREVKKNKIEWTRKLWWISICIWSHSVFGHYLHLVTFSIWSSYTDFHNLNYTEHFTHSQWLLGSAGSYFLWGQTLGQTLHRMLLKAFKTFFTKRVTYERTYYRLFLSCSSQLYMSK